MYTFEYQTTGTPVWLDIHPATHASAPAVVYLHGGALIWGSRRNLPAWQLELYRQAGFSVVTVDYRLAPETKLPAIVADVQAALLWLSREGSRVHIDPTRVAVVGHSAGGYLALQSGIFPASARPRAIVSFYGYGDVSANWYSQPSPFYRQQPAISLSDALSVVGSDEVSEGERSRFPFYLYCRQQGCWVQQVLGPDATPERVDSYCPASQVTPDFPPTLLLHGDRDTDVPFEQSLLMRDRLQAAGVDHQLVLLPGLGHAFDYEPSRPEVSSAFQTVLEFLKQRLC